MSMTWKDFKEAAEKAGVRDEDKIFYIVVGDYLQSIEFDKISSGIWCIVG